jgi:hypothetical protein
MPRRALSLLLASLISACAPGPSGPGANPASATPAAAASQSSVPVPTSDLGADIATHVVAFSDEMLAATKAIPRQVPAARGAGESLDAYEERATTAALAVAKPIRELVRRELTWLDGLGAAPCPIAGRYRAALNSYSILADVVWSGYYAPDSALLGQAVSNLDELNASVASAAAALSTAPDVCRIELQAPPAILPNQVIGTQAIDILRDPARLHESSMGNLVADAMRRRYPDVDAALLNSGGLRTDLVVSPPSAGEQPGEITRGEMLRVLPFGDRVVILTVTGAQLEAALLNGLAPACDPRPALGTFRFPQLSGLKVAFHCDGPTPVVDGMWKTPDGAAGPEVRLGAADTVRLVTNDYLYAGGDGYSMLAAGTNVQQPGDTLLDVAIDDVAAHSPVAAAVDGRILGP